MATLGIVLLIKRNFNGKLSYYKLTIINNNIDFFLSFCILKIILKKQELFVYIYNKSCALFIIFLILSQVGSEDDSTTVFNCEIIDNYTVRYRSRIVFRTPLPCWIFRVATVLCFILLQFQIIVFLLTFSILLSNNSLYFPLYKYI